MIAHDARGLDDVKFSLLFLQKFEVQPFSGLAMPQAFLEFFFDHLLEERMVDVEILLIELSFGFGNTWP